MLPMNMMPPEMPMAPPTQEAPAINPMILMLLQAIMGGQQAQPQAPVSAPMSNFPIADPTANPDMAALAQSFLRGRNV